MNTRAACDADPRRCDVLPHHHGRLPAGRDRGPAALMVGDVVGPEAAVPARVHRRPGHRPRDRPTLPARLLATPRAWGLYLLDCSTAPSLCVAVPHPRSDERCEDLGIRLWRAVPGSLLEMATVHRDALAGRADQARAAASLFHQAWTHVATIRPARDRTAGNTAWIPLSCPSRFTFICSRSAVIGRNSSGPGSSIPALLTTAYSGRRRPPACPLPPPPRRP